MAKQGVEELIGALRGQGIEAEQGVVRLAHPGVPVFGPVRDEEEQRRRARAINEPVQARLGFRVDPVEILENDQKGLDLRLAQQEARDRVERPLAALRRVETLPPGILDRQLEEGEQGRERGLQRTIQGEDLPGDLLADVPLRVPIPDPEVAS